MAASDRGPGWPALSDFACHRGAGSSSHPPGIAAWLRRGPRAWMSWALRTAESWTPVTVRSPTRRGGAGCCTLLLLWSPVADRDLHALSGQRPVRASPTAERCRASEPFRAVIVLLEVIPAEGEALLVLRGADHFVRYPTSAGRPAAKCKGTRRADSRKLSRPDRGRRGRWRAWPGFSAGDRHRMAAEPDGCGRW